MFPICHSRLRKPGRRGLCWPNGIGAGPSVLDEKREAIDAVRASVLKVS